MLLPHQPEINIGTVGHVDHGKTTLVEALTGIWTSAHSEELRRGITIKVGYADAAFYKCKNCPSPAAYGTSPKCEKCASEAELLMVVSFVDCPGHESLMTNMLSGSALMDGSILVIAANESVPQPQTREHLTAIRMLGMEKVLAVQNKVDLVNDQDARSNFKDITKFISESTASIPPVIPISAQHRLNIDYLIQSIDESFPRLKRDETAPPILQVLRSFDINTPGTQANKLKGGVLGGTLTSGRLSVGDEIEIRPGIFDSKSSKYSIQTTKVSSLGTSSGLVDVVRPGGLVAIGTTLDPASTKSDRFVGSIVGRPNELPPVHDDLSLKVELFDVAVGAPQLVKVENVKMGEILRLNLGTAATLGNVTSQKDDVIEAKLRRSVCAAVNSRVAISRKIADRWRLIGSAVIS